MNIMQGSIVLNALGQQLQVGEFLGKGGFGAVYRIKDFQLAVKALMIPFSDSDEMRAFVNEGTLAVGIRHKNVIAYEFFHNGVQFKDYPPYILMEYANGGTLTKLIASAKLQREVFSPEVLRDMMGQLVAGMEAINRTLVHRDIKPDNILLSDNVLKVSDFGLAKLAQEATRKMTFKGFGSLPYIAPEAWMNEKNTLSLDIYAMGMVFYELATLRHPFEIQTDDPLVWRDAHLHQAVEPPSKFNPSISPGISQLILKMVEKDTQKRVPNWHAVTNLLEAADRGTAQGNPLIAGMMKRRIEADAAARSAQLERERSSFEETEFAKLVISQAVRTVIRPLEEFFDEFNQQYDGDKITISGSPTTLSLGYSIEGPGISGKIEFRALTEGQFWKDVEVSDYGRIIKQRRLMLPELNKRRIQGFGLVRLRDGRGFNLALVERDGEIYGEWFTLLNRTSPLAQGKLRPDPFPFDWNEYEKEIRYVGVMHAYVTKVQAFDSTFLHDFFAQAII